ncbi:hypothetical protein FPV67DRAFT_1461777 [Lyophyllum atratum]|nr:hypothetical protein FPV67DRAFT_1461777 [Lyophyllum atratum]
MVFIPTFRPPTPHPGALDSSSPASEPVVPSPQVDANPYDGLDQNTPRKQSSPLHPVPSTTATPQPVSNSHKRNIASRPPRASVPLPGSRAQPTSEGDAQDPFPPLPSMVGPLRTKDTVRDHAQLARLSLVPYLVRARKSREASPTRSDINATSVSDDDSPPASPLDRFTLDALDRMENGEYPCNVPLKHSTTPTPGLAPQEANERTPSSSVRDLAPASPDMPALLDADVPMADGTAHSPPPAGTDAVLAEEADPLGAETNNLNNTFAPPSFLRPGRTALIEDGVVTIQEGGNAIFRYTAQPYHGFPTIDLGAPPLHNVSRDLVTQWSALDEVKLLLRPYRAVFDENPQEAVHRAEDMLMLALGEGARNIVISPPAQANKDPFRFPSPYPFLVSGITHAAAQELLDLRILSSDKATFFFDPFHPQNPRHLITIRGLTFRDTEEAAIQVADIVRARLVATPAVASYIHDHLMITDATAASSAFASLRATSIVASLPRAKGGNQLLWNIDWDPPQVKITDYFKLVHLVQGIMFPTVTRGTGIALINDLVFRCVGCKSMAHPTPLCPIPEIQGWLGFRKTSEGPDDLSIDAFHRPATSGDSGGSSGTGQVRGGRGGKRARGGRGRGRGFGRA